MYYHSLWPIHHFCFCTYCFLSVCRMKTGTFEWISGFSVLSYCGFFYSNYVNSLIIKANYRFIVFSSFTDIPITSWVLQSISYYLHTTSKEHFDCLKPFLILKNVTFRCHTHLQFCDFLIFKSILAGGFKKQHNFEGTSLLFTSFICPLEWPEENVSYHDF